MTRPGGLLKGGRIGIGAGLGARAIAGMVSLAGNAAGAADAALAGTRGAAVSAGISALSADGACFNEADFEGTVFRYSSSAALARQAARQAGRGMPFPA